MAAGCVQTPTLTRTDVSTSESLFPTFSVLTSTLPGSLSTTTFTTCTQTNSSIPCRPTVTSSVITLPGNTTRMTVSVTETVDVPITNIVTLFGSSCTTSSSSTPDPQSSSSTTTPDSTTDSTTIIFSTSTPPPTLITSSSVVTSDGSTFVDIYTSTSNPPPTIIKSTGTSLSSYTTSTVPPTTSTTNLQITTGTSLPNNGESHKKSSNIGPIVGGVVGGLAVLLVLGKKQSRFDDIFNPTPKSKPHYHKAKTTDHPEPKPYNYGLVGQGHTNPIGVTPPSSPPPGQSTFGNDIGHQAQGGHGVGHQGQGGNGTQGGNGIGQQGQGTNSIGQQGQGGNGIGQGGQGGNGVGQSGQGGNAVGQPSGHDIGYQPGNDIGPQPNQPPVQHLSHIRNPSLVPLLAGVGVGAAAAAGGSLASSSRPSSSRPSSSSSSQPIGPLINNAPQGQGYPPTQTAGPSSYPPALQNWSNTQGYAAQSGYSSSSAATNAQGYGSGPSMAGPSNIPLSQGSGSINSIGSGSSAYTSSRGGPSLSGGAGGVYNPALPGMVPLVATAAMIRDNNNRPLQQYEDPFARTGSPVSIQEQRILQVTNAEPSSSYRASGVYDPQAYYSGGTEASSSSSAVAGPSSEGSQAGSSSTGTADGKGRPLNLRGEKAALVHLDGGLYQEPSPDAPPPGPAPPAYTDS